MLNIFNEIHSITMTSWWMRWRLKTPASPLFTWPLIQVQIKEHINAPRHWPLCGQFTGDWWIPRTNGQRGRKCSHLMTSSWTRPSLKLNTTDADDLRTLEAKAFTFRVLTLQSRNIPVSQQKGIGKIIFRVFCINVYAFMWLSMYQTISVNGITNMKWWSCLLLFKWLISLKKFANCCGWP